jgi:protein ImuA
MNTAYKNWSMNTAKSDIIRRLRMDILPLEGFKMSIAGETPDPRLGPINRAFPPGGFPLGAIHEFISSGPESAAATGGFISALISPLMKKGGAGIWIGSAGKIFPPALQQFGIDPDRIIFIDLQKEKDLLWTVEEALKCHGLAAVVAELPTLSFTVSRRFQLAVEQSQVTGFIQRPQTQILNTNASVSRWKISPLPTETYDALPGLGYPRWNVELLKIRNGKPGTWQMEWSDHCFNPISKPMPTIIAEPKRKTG